MNTVGKPATLGGIDPLRRLRLDAHRGLARPDRHPRARRPRLRHAAPLRAGHRLALRRQSYDPNDDGHFDVEYADVLGIPFDLTAEPVPVKPQKPRETVLVKAITPERDACEIVPSLLGERPILRGAST